MGYNARPYKDKSTTKYHQGYYKPLNPEKYMGNINHIVYRSGLELKFMQYLDTSKQILKWNSEGVTIVYRDMENHDHRYYPDFYYECINQSNPNDIDKVLVEVKAHSETVAPVKPLNESVKSLRNYEYKVRTFLKNKLKWGAAKEWCDRRGIKFIIITEVHLKKANL